MARIGGNLHTRHIVYRSSAFRIIQYVGFPHADHASYPLGPQLYTRLPSPGSSRIPLILPLAMAGRFFGAQYRAYTLDSSGSRLPLPGLPAEFTTELPAKLCSGRTLTCWVTLSNFIPFHRDSQRLGLRWAQALAWLCVPKSSLHISSTTLK